MINRITMHDDERGDFVYERDETDPFRWHLRVSHKDGLLSRRLETNHDSRDVLWNVAIETLRGVTDTER